MYSIEYTESALSDLEYFRKTERQLIVDQIDIQLIYEPGIETPNRKRLRRNALAEWELRIGKFRVFYDVIAEAYDEHESDDEQALIRIVKIEAVGQKKHNKLFIRGEEFEL